MSGVEFELLSEPPPRGGMRAVDPRVVALAEVLRANPGKWARYPVPLSPGSSYSIATAINGRRTNAPKALRDEGFQAVARKDDVYVCYMPEERGQ